MSPITSRTAPGGSGELRVGALRPSQLLHTYGVGAVADLPNLSVMVLGLDEWRLEHAVTLPEERLLAIVKRKLGPQVADLRCPPYTPEDSHDPLGAWTRVGVPVTVFPRWLRCSDNRCNRLAPSDSGLFTLLEDRYRPEQTRFVHDCRGQGRSRPTAVPARFVVACPAGHLDDFPWLYFAHRGADFGSEHTLKLTEGGTTGEAASVYVSCSCGIPQRSMAEAIGVRGESVLPACRGRHPHLGRFGECAEQLRTMALGATNSWFPMQLRVLTLPRADEPLESAVAEHWASLRILAQVPAEAGATLLRNYAVWPLFEPYGAQAVLAAIVRRAATVDDNAGEPVDDELDIATPEWRALTGRPVNHPDFTTEREARPPGHPELDQVVLVKRLREVSALYGFTRIDAPEWEAATVRGPLLDQQRAPLSGQPPTWVPCAEIRGEGIFLKFQEDRIAAWETGEAVRRRGALLETAHTQWCAQRGIPANWPGLRYVLLHTFAHVLIREFALECGYGASGIRERIYSRTDGPEHTAGVLLFTAAPDSEGTLGGLVSLGRAERLGTLIDQALAAARLCSSDPLCAEHDPSVHGRQHGAACHACLFAAETSCERGNHFLDRELLVATLAGRDCGFFDRPTPK